MQSDLFANKVENDTTDYLLGCLLGIGKYYGRTASPNGLIANLPLVNNKLTPSLFLEAAKRIQLSSTLVEKNIDELKQASLPLVLILKNNKACVLVKLNDDNTGEFIVPQRNKETNTLKLNLNEIAREYTGIAIEVQPTYNFEERANEYKVERQPSWFWDTIWHYRSLYYHAALATVFINLFIMAAPLFVMNVYDRVVPNQAMQTLWVLAIGITIIYIFDLLLKIIRSYLIDVSGKKADVILSGVLFKHLLELQMSSRPASAGAFANNFYGYEAVRDFFTSATLISVIDLPFIILFILVIAAIGGWLAFIPLLAIPVVIGVSFMLEIPIRKSVEESFFGATQKQAILVESINRLETIKTSSAEAEYLRKWDFYTDLVARLSMKSRLYSSLTVNFAAYTLSMVYVIIIVAGVYSINHGNLTLGGLIAIAILSSRALLPLTQVASLITRYHQAKIGLKTLDHVMALPKDRLPNKEYISRPKLMGEITVENVSFNYPHQLSPALYQVTFKINPKEKVAILGQIGSGKSTLLKLLMGLYRPSSGTTRIDGVDINQIDPADVRHNVGYVPQESGLFYGSLRDNICKACPTASDEDLLKVTEITGINHYTDKHPSGFDLIIGENGTGLSGGQQQSVAIARALLPNPPILMFDDCTSDMDDTSEGELKQKLSEYMRDKTLILVTHKLSMLSLVDRIIILANGRIVADGPKADILKKLGQ